MPLHERFVQVFLPDAFILLVFICHHAVASTTEAVKKVNSSNEGLIFAVLFAKLILKIAMLVLIGSPFGKL